MRQPIKRALAPLREQSGISLIETVLALALVGIVAIAFLQALRTTSFSTGSYEAWVTASNLAQSQVEEVKAAAYDSNAPNQTPAYPVMVTLPDSYEVSVSAEEPVSGKQEVTVAVSGGGKNIVHITFSKTNW